MFSNHKADFQAANKHKKPDDIPSEQNLKRINKN